MGEQRDFFSELKRRKVFRVAAMYAVGAWGVVQVADATFDVRAGELVSLVGPRLLGSKKKADVSSVKTQIGLSMRLIRAMTMYAII